MLRSIKKLLTLAIALHVLIGCSATRVTVSNPNPAPWFPSCATVRYIGKAPDYVLDDVIRMVNVMKKLQTLQAEDERDTLGCPNSSAATRARQ